MNTLVREVTDAEMAILSLLWDHGPSPIWRLTEMLSRSGMTLCCAKVEQSLNSLESKGFIGVDRLALVHVFRAHCSRDEYIGGQLRAMIDKYCGGLLTPLLPVLLQHETLNAAQRRELRTRYIS